MKTLVAAAVVASVASLSTAQAGTITVIGGTVTATDATAATPTFAVGNFGTSSTNGLVSTGPVYLQNGGSVSFSPNSSTPQAGVYSGNVANVAASPFTGTGLPQGNYLVAQPNDPVTINFVSTRNAFSLLWGSVDSYNGLELDFMSTLSTTPVQVLTISGTDVANAIGGGFLANGTKSAYVTLNTAVSFNEVVLRSTQSAFEFDPSVRVPEPASLALLGMGLAGIGLIRGRKSARLA